MDRISFIKNLVGSTLSFSYLPKVFPKTTIHREIYSSYVRGFQFYKSGIILSHIRVGEELTLTRDVNNKYDDCAIAIRWNGIMIGYVAKEDNLILSNMLVMIYANYMLR